MWVIWAFAVIVFSLNGRSRLVLLKTLLRSTSFLRMIWLSSKKRYWILNKFHAFLLPMRSVKSFPVIYLPQWGAADAEIKVPSDENTELKRSPFKVWSRSVYSFICCAYCQRFPRCSFLSFRSINLHFFQNLSRFLLCWLWLIHGPCVGPQNKIGHPVGCRFPCWVPTEYK